MKILIVEDDAEAAAYLGRGLSEAGHSTDIAEDGEVGHTFATSNDYDVLIIDRMLPKKDGLTLINELRNVGKQVPILVLSALSRGRRPGKGSACRRRRLHHQALRLLRTSRPYRGAGAAPAARPECVRPRSTAIGDLELDRLSHTVSARAGQDKVALQPREFPLLEYLMRHA